MMRHGSISAPDVIPWVRYSTHQDDFRPAHRFWNGTLIYTTPTGTRTHDSAQTFYLPTYRTRKRGTGPVAIPKVVKFGTPPPTALENTDMTNQIIPKLPIDFVKNSRGA